MTDPGRLAPQISTLPLAIRPRRLGPIGLIFTAVYLAGCMGTLTVLFLPQSGTAIDSGPTPLFVGAWGLLYAATGLVYLTRQLRLTRANIALGVLGLLFVVSATWSGRPTATFTYGTVVLLNLLFIAQVSASLDLDGFLRLFRQVTLILCVLGLGLYLAGVEAATYIDVHDRLTPFGTVPMRGLFNHKISAAYYAAMAIIVSLVMQRGAVRLLTVSFLSIFIILTGSATGIALVGAGIGLLLLLRLALRSRLTPNTFVAILGGAGTGAALLGYYVLPALLALLGRDPTLTGRTILWAWGISAGLQRPVLGWGYTGYLGSPAAEVARRRFMGLSGYDVPHFHNGYIQAFAELGTIGVILMLALVLGGARAYYSLAVRTRTDSSLAMCVLLLLLGTAGAVMNTFFKYNELTVLMFGIAALGILGMGMLPRHSVST